MSEANAGLTGADHGATRLNWRLDNSYMRLPEAFWAPAAPAAFSAPRMLVFNQKLAQEIGLASGPVDANALAPTFAGAALPDGAARIAQAYAGHQFGNFTMLGDGRALLVGEQLTPDGGRVDLQFKGSGPTAFSRGGDGFAAVGPMLREYLVSEAMHALGVPTTRSLAVVATGDVVFRDRPLPGATLTRVAASHIRFGTFQYAAALGEPRLLQELAGYAIARHDVDLAGDPAAVHAFLLRVMQRHVDLVLHWIRIGFVHGVMNTDNMTVSGETIDYGPCAFIDRFDPAAVFSSIDHAGRYAFSAQPAVAQWNLARLAEALLPLLDADRDAAIRKAEAALNGFAERYQTRWRAMMWRKLGLDGEEADDMALVADLLHWMRDAGADYTNTFRALCDEAAPVPPECADPAFGAWRTRWLARRSRNAMSEADSVAMMRAANPAVIPRNHMVQRALDAAGEGDMKPFFAALEALAAPYDSWRGDPAWTQPGEGPFQTFCGT